MSLSLVIVAFVVLLTSGGGVQAVFTPADSAALNAAVQGCLGETADGSCPIFAASNDGTAGNPNGVMGDWNVSRVTSLKESTSNFHLFVFFFVACSMSLWFSNNFGFPFFLVRVQHQLH